MPMQEDPENWKEWILWLFEQAAKKNTGEYLAPILAIGQNYAGEKELFRSIVSLKIPF